ncbi:MAG: 2-C-methyl-D-erythritol 2,4-cyclodiphosphate synthase [Candidatus Omnitrophota bacterium]
MRIGIGYDIHRLVEGRPLVLGGVDMPHTKGLEGHSDADVLLHSICDAILGALGEGDIGTRFPDTDPKYKDISSKELLQDVADLMDRDGFFVENLDCVVVAEEPKIAPYRAEMIKSISDVLRISPDLVNVKAKTSEKLGEIGKGEAVAAHAVVLLKEKER